MSVIEWLLESDPSIRWQVMCDLTDASDDVVARERGRVASEGWGSRLLGLQALDGDWGGGPWLRASWKSTMETLMLLRELGVDPTSERCRHAIALVRDRSTGDPSLVTRPSSKARPRRALTGGSLPAVRSRKRDDGAIYNYEKQHSIPSGVVPSIEMLADRNGLVRGASWMAMTSRRETYACFPQ